MTETTAAIRQLNDSFRKHLAGGRILVTPGLSDRPDLASIIKTVSSFEEFDTDNDPYGEHDFGAFDHEGNKIFWKIDYYDRTLTFGSPDPANPSVTTRVLTVMLADEY